MFLWIVSKDRFPAVPVFRRYLKLEARWCEDANLMNTAWIDVPDDVLPFDKRSLQIQWPDLSMQHLWPDPPNS